MGATQHEALKAASDRHIRGSGDGFYRDAMTKLNEAGIDFLVGGAYALREFTGVVRDTKDFDIFLREHDVGPALETIRRAGYRADIAFPHWLAKAHHGETFIDLVFRAGNGLCDVDDRWFEQAPQADLLGVHVRLVAPEFMIWQKAYVMERERFDGADLAHLLRSCPINWPQLVSLFGEDWRLLLSHLVLFGFIYPSDAARIPGAVLHDLLERLSREQPLAPPAFPDHQELPEPQREPVCRGTLLSRQQYLPDVERWGYRDARQAPRCHMTEDDIHLWTDAIDK